MAPLPLPTHQHVVALYNEQGSHKNGFKYDELIWIKYGENVTEAEAVAQTFAYEHVDRNIIRIPEIYDCFSEENMTYILMERVDGEDYRDYVKSHPTDGSEIYRSLVGAVRHFWALQIPADASPGPFVQQIPVDRFFSDRDAHQTFQTITEFEQWINRKLIDHHLDERVDFNSEQLLFCHCDLASHNIMILENGTLYIIDFGMSGLYSRVFEVYALFHQFGSKLAKRLWESLFGRKPSRNLRPISLVARINASGG